MKNLFWKTAITETTMNQLSSNPQAEPENSLSPPTPPHVFNSGDIVYLKARPGKSIGLEWPALGTIYEVDCKLLERVDMTLWNLITGHGIRLTVCVSDLVPAHEKYMYMQTPLYIACEDTELFPQGTILSRCGDYWGNESLGVYISDSRFSEILHLFIKK